MRKQVSQLVADVRFLPQVVVALRSALGFLQLCGETDHTSRLQHLKGKKIKSHGDKPNPRLDKHARLISREELILAFRLVLR